jgi:hypothetical protein
MTTSKPKFHSSVALITNSSTVIFGTNAFNRAAGSIEHALYNLLRVIGSDLSVEDILDTELLSREIANGDSEDEVAGRFEDNELSGLMQVLDYGDYTRDD